MAVEYHCCGAGFFEHIAIIVVLVVFSGLMSGLTLGLMSLSLVDLEVLSKSGTDKDRKHAGTHAPIPTSPPQCVPLSSRLLRLPGPRPRLRVAACRIVVCWAPSLASRAALVVPVGVRTSARFRWVVARIFLLSVTRRP
jgi:metal transporter CNNM